jgi:PhnB protein
VPDGDAVFSSALAAGATAVTAMSELFWGDRVGRVRDPFGDLWWIRTGMSEVDAQEAERRGRAAEFIAAMEYVASGEFVRST